MALRKCENNIACSRYIQSCFNKLGIDSITIRNGVEVSSHGQPELADVPKLRPIVLVVGSFIKRKNNLPIIKAFKEPECKDLNLLMLGAGNEQKLLQREASQNVYFFGHVENVQPFFKAARLYVSNSLSEGMPNSVLEAITAGVPIILSDIPPHRELNEFPVYLAFAGWKFAKRHR